MLKSSGRNRVSSLVACPVFLINKFNVKSVEAEQFLKEYEEDAKVQKSTWIRFCTTNQGIGKSTVYINYAV